MDNVISIANWPVGMALMVERDVEQGGAVWSFARATVVWLPLGVTAMTLSVV